MNATQLARITDGSSELIGKSCLLYYAGNDMHPASIASHREAMERAFQKVAAALGFSVSKIEEDAPTDHVARFFRLPTDANPGCGVGR